MRTVILHEMHLQIKNIIKEAQVALYTDDDGNKRPYGVVKMVLLFHLLPLAVAIYFVCGGNILKGESPLVDNILVICSIFSGLLFSLIIVIVDKAKKIKVEVNTKFEDQKGYMTRYLNFSKHLIVKISYAILISILIIALCILLNIDLFSESTLLSVQNLKAPVVSILVLYFAIQFLLLIIDIVSDMYDVFLDEINPNR